MNLRLVARGAVFSSVPGLRLLALALFVAGSMGATSPTHHRKPARSAFTVGQYVEVARRPVSHKSVEYTFVAHVTNHGAAASDVACTVRVACPERRHDHHHHDDDDCDDDHDRLGAPKNGDGSHHSPPDEGPELLDDRLTFGNVGAGKTVRSLDTFRLRQRGKDRIAFDRFRWSCTADTNRSPLANAGPDQTVVVTSLVTLDGTGSSDPDGNPLVFRWSFTSRPQGSAAALDDPAAVHPTFVVDRPGEYQVQLIVNDGQTDSPADTVQIDVGFDPTFATGSAEQDATPDGEGCLGADIVLATTTGVKATLAAGTCLREPLGAPVTGPVTIGIDDAGGTPAGSGLAGVVRLFVRTAVGDLVPAALDPPAQLELPLVEPAPAGTWYTHVFVQGEYLATQLPAEGPFIRDAIVPVPGEPDRLPLDAAMVLGVGFEPPPATAARSSRGAMGVRALAAPGPHTVSLTFPSDPSMPDPRVFQWLVINRQTAHIVAVGDPYDGIGANELDVRGRGGHPFTATLVPAGGPYRFEVTSDYANRFALKFLVGPDRNGPFTEVGPADATGGCAEEACTDQIYVGWVTVDVRALDVPGLVAMRDTIVARLPPGARMLWHLIATLPSGAMTARLSILGLDTSTQLLPPILPTRWAKVAGDRTLLVDSIPLGVTVKHGTPQGTGFGSPVDGTGVRWTIYDDNEDPICCLPIALPADAPPPVVLGAAGRTLRVFEPSPDVLAINASGPGVSAAHNGTMSVRAELSFRGPGTLQIDIDPGWFQNVSGNFDVSWTLDSGEGAECHRSGGGTFSCFPGASGAVPITQRGTRTLDVWASITGGNNASASGRAVTLTFTPSP